MAASKEERVQLKTGHPTLIGHHLDRTKANKLAVLYMGFSRTDIKNLWHENSTATLYSAAIIGKWRNKSNDKNKIVRTFPFNLFYFKEYSRLLPNFILFLQNSSNCIFMWSVPKYCNLKYTEIYLKCTEKGTFDFEMHERPLPGMVFLWFYQPVSNVPF